MSSNRYYQPKDSKDAMRFIEKLFNKYRNAKLTKDLLAYHNKLTQQVAGNIKDTARRESNPKRVAEANSMVHVMQQWTKIKLSGKNFNGQMRHFKFEPNGAHQRFKRNHIKLSHGSNYRSSLH
ncbi:hypothetical protein WR164_05280 [Philodulcilactobacillus myokoensis]|uniref:Uncharacterized protein n=1 Tax=Philodulcilactobacillus myokoensis TaxID=2929573 RepID=A0A9W6B042_9LACO|nr:hypothetical protein [Philodulcilactobacillus myokoensis]GLB46549.1 hypothetical protein WR164_05280 [Philodulcilactobacillus myokoensis]